MRNTKTKVKHYQGMARVRRTQSNRVIDSGDTCAYLLHLFDTKHARPQPHRGAGRSGHSLPWAMFLVFTMVVFTSTASAEVKFVGPVNVSPPGVVFMAPKPVVPAVKPSPRPEPVTPQLPFRRFRIFRR